jgi:uncharacterized protein YdhG (YjbR/CyaY superfamily)
VRRSPPQQSVVKAGRMKKTAARQVKLRKKHAGSPVDQVDQYVAQAHPTTRSILQKIRAIVRKEAPRAEERISYRMPAFFKGGAIVYFAPFKHHIGIFPPVDGDAALDKALAKYRGPKGNLRFPLDAPMPYPLIRRVVRARLKAIRAKAKRR